MGKSYISPSGTAKELLKIYFGNSNNLAQHIDKGYIGDQNGIARLIFGENVPPLPSGYTNLPYLESDGTKWLNTRFIPIAVFAIKYGYIASAASLTRGIPATAPSATA